MKWKNHSKKDIFDDVYMFSLIIVLLSIVICGLWENSIIKRREVKWLEEYPKEKDEKEGVFIPFPNRTITVKFDLDEVKIGD